MPTSTARHTLRPARALAAVWLILACVDSPTAPSARVASLQITSGNLQEGAVGTELAQPLTTRLLDAHGGPLAGHTVVFRVVAGGGKVSDALDVSDADGHSKTRWTLGTNVADAQRVQALVVDDTGYLAEFEARAVPGGPYAMTSIAGDGQRSNVGAALPESLVVRIVDTYGNAVPSVRVRWHIEAGSATLRDTLSRTSNAGFAWTRMALGDTAGPVTVTAQADTTLPGDSAGPPVHAGSLVVQFRAWALAGVAAHVVLRAGDGQSSRVASMVPIAPAVTVRDAHGNPVSGVAVRFRVVAGGGQLQSDSVVSNDSGIARVGAWTLGTTVGANRLRAIAAGLDSVEFAATATPGLPASLVKLGGDGQQVLPDSVVPFLPTVRVADPYDNPVPGVRVIFVVDSPADSLAGGEALTDTAGLARPLRWRLGAEKGFHLLRASLPGAVDISAVVFTATAATSSDPNIVFGPGTPAAGATVGDQLSIRYVVGGVTQIQAILFGRSISLGTYDQETWFTWHDIDLKGLPLGPFALVLTATDTRGHVADLVVPLVRDLPPTIAVERPATGDVAVQGRGRIVARCVDESPGTCVMSAVLESNPAVRLDGVGRLDGTLPVSPPSGADGVWVVVTAMDTRGQQAVSQRRFVLTPPGAHWAPWAEVRGVVVDVAGDSLLYRAQRETDGTLFGLVIGRRSSAVRDTVSRSDVTSTALLTPHGAIWNENGGVSEWRDRVAMQLPNAQRLGPGSSYGYALLLSDSYRVPVVRDLAIGTSTEVRAPAGRPELAIPPVGAYWQPMASHLYLAPDGTLVSAWFAGATVLWRSGIFTLYGGGASTTETYYPMTDGHRVVYLEPYSPKHLPASTLIWVLDGSGASFNSWHDGYAPLGAPDTYRAVVGGWVAMLSMDELYRTHLNLGNPAGNYREVACCGASIEGLAPTGEVIYRIGSERLLAKPDGSAPLPLGRAEGTVLWRSGRWILLLGSQVFELQP